MRLLSFIFGILVLFSFSCKKKNDYPNTPEITYKHFYTYGNVTNSGYLYQLAFTFIDGDGDVGLEQDADKTIDKDFWKDDTIFFQYNFFMDIYKIENDDTILVDLSFPFRYRIPYITHEMKDRPLRGTVEIDMLPFPNTLDSVIFEFYIVDRAFNHSNREQTPLLVLK